MANPQKNISEWQPQWVALPILDLVRLVHQFGDDTESLGQWVKRFSDDLLFCNTDSEDELTRRLLEDAKEKVQKLSTAGKKGGKASAKARKQKQKSQEAAGNGAASKSPTSCDQFTADASTREGEDERNHRGNTGTMESGTSANNYGDAARREAADGDTDGNVAVARTTTVSNPLALDMPGLDKASDPRGYNTADVPPSYGPEDGTIDNPATPAGSSHPAGNTPPQFVINHNQRHRPQKPQANSPPRSSEDVRLFALDRNLDIDDARMWYQMNFVDRPGCDKDGVAINNWKGHCTAYCKAEAERRKAG